MRKANLAVALGLSLVALYLAFRFMTHAGPLWRDEASTLHFANQATFADVLDSLDLVSIPPLYPTILRGWSRLGWASDDAGARGLGFVVGAAVLAGIWLIALALGTGPPVVLLALFGIHGIVLATVAAVRPYGLGTLAVLAAACATLRLVESPRVLTFVAAAALMTLAVQLQYQNALFVAIFVAAGLAASAWSRNGRSAVLVIGCAAIAVASLIPYLGILGRSQQWRVLHRSLEPVDPAALLQRFADLLSMGSFYLLVLWSVLGALACYGVARTVMASTPQRGAAQIFAGVVFLGGAGAMLAFFLLVDRALQPWHVVPVIALMAFGLEVIVATAAWPAATSLVIAAFAAALGLPAALQHVDVRQTNIDLIAQRLERDAVAGDLIVANPWFMATTLHRYYRGGAAIMTIPPLDDFRIFRLDQVRAQMISPEPLRPVETAIAATLRGGRRVWVVGTIGLPGPDHKPQPLPPAPHPVSGWSETAYTIGWSDQLGAFLRSHAQRATRYNVPLLQPVSGYENAQLLMVEGWVE